MKSFFYRCILLFLCSPIWLSAQEKPFDVVVYGGTSAGVVAAVKVARDGGSAVLIEPSRHVGGLSSGGLGATDIGNKRCIGGMSRAFYHDIWLHYQNNDAWNWENRVEFKGRGHREGEKTAWTFEPHVAERLFEKMISESNVVLVRGERLNRKNGVRIQNQQIDSIEMESGKIFSGRMFIDATYEGDLLAAAGVSYMLGREPNSRFNETLNGVQTGHAVHHQFVKNVDPYVVPGDKSSGLLEGIDPDGPGTEFSGDKRLQAYCFRLCATDQPGNRMPWPKPRDYNEKRFELLLRNFEAGDLRKPWHPVLMPNRKSDSNNNFAVSTDYIGMNYGYVEADYAERERIIANHLSYTQGLMWTLANHLRVPGEIRAHFRSWGLCKDEFSETGGWPHQLYIREARRMLGDYVMTEKNCLRREVVTDSVGMGAYNMDSHNVQRYVNEEGNVRNEGDVQVRSKPYPISYRSVIPKRGEVGNLLTPTCLSASHIAFGSIRMEPVFMVLGESCASAALQAVRTGRVLQDLDYEILRKKLEKDGQVLDFES